MSWTMLTNRQAEAVEWALDPMVDYWCSESGAHERDGELFADSMLPRLDRSRFQSGNTLAGKSTAAALILSENNDINADLLYRLEVQLVDVSEAEATPAARGTARAAKGAAYRIRMAVPALAELPYGAGYLPKGGAA